MLKSKGFLYLIALLILAGINFYSLYQADEKPLAEESKTLPDTEASQLSTHPLCDSIFEIGEKMLEFVGGQTELLDFNWKHVFPILKKVGEQRGEVVSKFIYGLVISPEGKVLDVAFKSAIEEPYKSEIKKVLLYMPDWIPGEVDGGKVCMKVWVPINCIKWE